MLQTSVSVGAFTPRTSYDWNLAGYPGGTLFFNGKLDEMTLYRRALTQAEIVEIFASGDCGKMFVTDHDAPNLLVNAGPDQNIFVPQSAELAGAVSDRRSSASDPLAVAWSKVSGPGAVRFAPDSLAVTTAYFEAPGDYVLRLSASAGALVAADDVAVHVEVGLFQHCITFHSGNGTQSDPLNRYLPPGGTTWLPCALTGNSSYTVLPGTSYISGNFVQNSTDRIRARFILPAQFSNPTISVQYFADNAAAVYLNGTQIGTQVFANLFSNFNGSPTLASSTDASLFLPGENILEFEVWNSFGPMGLDYTATLCFDAPGQPGNVPPVVTAGPDQVVEFPAQATLAATVTDDGASLPDYLDVTWTLASGPGTVAFGNPKSAATTASFTQPGNYVLLISATDGEFTVADSLTVSVQPSSAGNTAPVVEAGPDLATGQFTPLVINGLVADDGRPQAAPTIRWRMVSGPGAVSFQNPNAAVTSAVFGTPGLYVLELSATDGLLTRLDTLSVNVQPAGFINHAPSAVAGLDVTTRLGNQPIILSGQATDDGFPQNWPLSYHWEFVSSPGAAEISSPNTLTPTLRFGAAGIYVVRFTVSDGLLSTSDDLTVTVTAPPAPDPLNQAPVVNAGPDQTLTTASTTNLAGTVTDDGLPGGSVFATWSKVSGPGAATFGDIHAAGTTVAFNFPGTYVLRLTASDGQAATSDDVQISVASISNQPPQASAGPDQTIALGQTTHLGATVTDDGLPYGGVTVSWSILSGPGAATLTGTADGGADATFARAGIYRLRLTANDGQFTASDDVDITVTGVATQPPVVTLLAPGGGSSFTAGQSVTISARGTDPDAGGGISQIEFQVDGQTVASDPAPDATGLGIATWPASLGTHTITAIATDYSGTTGTSAPMTITVTPPVPSVALTYPYSGSAFAPGSALQVQATASAGAGGAAISQVQFFANGTLIGADTTAPYSIAWMTPAGLGDHQLVARATDASGAVADSAMARIRVVADPTVPATVELLSPTPGATVTEPVPVTGTVQNPNLRDYRLEYRRKSDDCPDWVTFATGNAQVSGGALGTFDPTVLLNGLYEVRLVARDAFGTQLADTISLSVEGGMKVGLFTVAFQDLQVPLAGIPLTVTRIYDSRDQCSGDFGHGWRLDLDSIRLELNAPIGSGWNLDITDGTLTAPPVYQLADPASHVASVRMPDGATLRFSPKLVFNRPYNRLASVLDADGDDVGQAWVPLGNSTPMKMIYRARGGTQGATLAPRGYRATGNVGGTTVAGDATFFPGDPYGGELLLATEDNTTLDAPLVTDATGWTLTFKDGRVFQFDGTGRLESMTDTNGNTLAIVRGGGGRIERVAHSSGRQIVFVRNAQGWITEITDPAGNTLHYAYDANGDLRAFYDRVTDPATAANPTQGFAYKPGTHYLDDIRDAKGVRAVRNEYDTQGRLTATTDAKNRRTTFAHNVGGRTEVVNRPLGQTETIQYDNRGNVIRVTNVLGEATSFTYDADNNRLTRTDPLNRTTRYTYDAFGSVLSVQAPHKPGENPNDFATRYTYDAKGNILSITSPTGAVENRAYDARGNLLSISDESGLIIASWVYDARGNATREGDSFSEMEFEFNGADQMTKMTDSTGRVTTSEYDLNGQLTAMTTNGVRSVFTLDEEGRELASDYGNGITSLFEYNAAGDEWTTASGPTLGTIQREFDTDGSVKAWHSPGGATTSFELDAAGRMASQTDGLGAQTQFTYDAAGRTTAVTDVATGATVSTEYDAAGQPTKATDAAGKETEFTYTPDGRPETVKNARGFLWEYRYTPTTVKVIDPLQREKISQFTPHGLPEVVCCGPGAPYQVTYLLNSGDDAEESPLTITDAGNHVRSFDYGDDGILTGVTDLAGNMFAFEYNAAFELSAVKYPSGAVAQSFTYDALDNPATVTFGDGSVHSYTYGADNRIATETLPAGPVLGYTYDLEGRTATVTASNGDNASFTYNAANSPLNAQNSAGTAAHEYDVNGRLVKLTTPVGGMVEYEYDINGRVSKLTSRASATATAAITQYRYDAVGNLDRITDPLGGITVLEYDAVNRLYSRTLPNGVITEYTYDSRDMIETIVHRKPDLSILASAVYERQGNGEPTRITREDGTYTLYGYDAAHRLTNEERRAFGGAVLERIDYTYDVDGKRTSKTTGGSTATYTYGAGQRLTQAGAQTLTYDAGGRVQTMGGLTFTYKNNDQLASVSDAASGYAETFQNDALGRRVKGVRGGQERRFITAPMVGAGLDAPHIIADGAGQPLSTYIYQGSVPLMRINAAGQPEYYLTDAMGSVIGLADSAAAPVATFRYDGFGTPTIMTGTASAAPGGDYRFQAHWQETATGLYHMRARDYDPRTGRFLTRDPEPYTDKEPESLMPYVFANNNPMYYSDPTGRFTLTEISVANGINTGIRAAQSAIIRRARRYVTDKIADAAKEFLLKGVDSLFPNSVGELFKNGPASAGREFDKMIKSGLCGLFKLPSSLYIEPSIAATGEPQADGITCAQHAGGMSAGGIIPRPDFIFSSDPPTAKKRSAWIVGEIKLSAQTMYRAYVNPGAQINQFRAITNYAGKYAIPRTAVFLTFFKGKPETFKALEELMKKSSLKKGVILLIISAQ